MRSIDNRLLRLEDRFGTCGPRKPRQHLRVVVKSADRLPSLEGAKCPLQSVTSVAASHCLVASCPEKSKLDPAREIV